MKQFDWKGVMPAITTQFDENGVLDLKAFRNNLSNQIKAGVDLLQIFDTHSFQMDNTLHKKYSIEQVKKNYV